MLDISRGETAASIRLPTVEFLRIELAPLMTGAVFVSLTATTVDPDEPQLLDQEIVNAPVSSVDELIALIRTHVRIGSESSPLTRSN